MIQKRYGYFLLLWLLNVITGLAQTTTYPVQVNVHMLPPYSLYLSDYYSGTRERLTITLINRDQLKPTVNVRLRMIITAPGGIRLQTNDNVRMEPLPIDAGMPVRLTQEDLAPYFLPSNLITQGYLAAGKLPEGMVEFCFQAVEAYTGQVLSTSACTRAWITSQKPPLLSLPRNNESIVFRDPLNVMFQWTPLHQGLAQVEYDFILKELWDNGMTAQAAFAYSPEIYRETTRSTSIIYGPMQPPLIAGKRYAWCVRAKAREGMDEVNAFQNDGYSEIRTFMLQDNCTPPEYVEATAERKRINLKWGTLPEYIGFRVSYRVKSADGKTQAEWKEQQTLEPTAILYGLESGATYEYRVASSCIAGQPVYSPVFTIALPAVDTARLAQCGIMPNVNLTNQEPVKELKVNEIFKAGDFPITIVNISGSGTFTGEGWTIIPWLNDAKVAVEFKSITINTDRQMINGFVEAKYDKNEGQIANLDDVFEGGFDVGNVKTGLTKVDYKFDFTIPGVEAFALNDKGDLVITDSDNVPHVVTPQDKEGAGNEGNKVVVFPMTVQDKNGDVYQVEKVTEKDANGNTKEVAKATKLATIGQPLAAGSFDPRQLNGDKAIVTFNKGAGHYAFDTWEAYYDKISLIEDKYEKLYTDYYAPWKLLPSGKTDKLSATIVIKDQAIKPEQVIFKTPLGTEYKSTYADGAYTFQVAAGPESDVQELYALYPKGDGKYYTLGKLGIATYAAQTQKVVLVPVNDAPINIEAVKQKLRSVYGPLGISWEVTQDDSYPYDNDKLMQGSSGLSTYNDEMKTLNQMYASDRAFSYDKSSNYIFLLKATGSQNINERDITGFMPRGAQFGYIFTSEVKQQVVAQVVAHELGHGRWKLYHPFDKHYGGFEEARYTKNLMSYDTGRLLAKWQWDAIGDPAMLVSIFESDQISEYTSQTYTQKVLQQLRCAYMEGKTSYEGLERPGVYAGQVAGLGYIRLTIFNKPVVLKKGVPKEHWSGGRQNKKMQAIDYGGLVLDYYGEKEGTEAVQTYLFPAGVGVNGAESDALAVLEPLHKKATLTDEDIESIRQVANCGAQYFTVSQKIDFISKIVKAHENSLTETYEDLILDIVENYRGNYRAYAQEFLDSLSKHDWLMKKLFYGLDNEDWAWGIEDNADRFAQAIFQLWIATTYSSRGKYKYVETEDIMYGRIFTPYCLAYQGKSFFPKMSYGKPIFREGKINIPFSVTTPDGDKNSTFVYDYFQPVFLVKEYGNTVTYLNSDIPAIMFAGIVDQDNFDRVINRISLTADVVLSFTGVGNLTKLRHLSKAKQVGRIMLAGLEFSTSVLDIILNYTDLCTDPEFCGRLKTYNFYVQMSLVGGEAVSELYKQGLRNAKASAKAAYEAKRANLIARYGENNERIKLLDEHFGIRRVNVTVTGDYLEHEYHQMLKLGQELGDGAATFIKSEQGVEGIYRTVNGEIIPFSLKRLTPDLGTGNGVKNIYRTINENAQKIKDAVTSTQTATTQTVKQYCKFGNEANTIIRVDVTNMSRDEMMDYYLSIAEDRRQLLFGPPGVFREIVIVDKDGLELIFENYQIVQQ